MGIKELIEALQEQIDKGNEFCDLLVYMPATFSHEEVALVTYNDELGVIITTY